MYAILELFLKLRFVGMVLFELVEQSVKPNI